MICFDWSGITTCMCNVRGTKVCTANITLFNILFQVLISGVRVKRSKESAVEKKLEQAE